MKILILGGTAFLGKHLVEAALHRGHDITTFNRGKTNISLFPEVEKLYGDRDGDLAELAGEKWDVVIDTSGYVPRIVNKSVEALRDSVDRYIFISSVSVYRNFSKVGIDEADATGVLADESTETVNGDTYGPLKVLCENKIEQAMPGRSLVIRPGIIVGPDDPNDRFTYWPDRISRGGKIIVPGSPQRRIQIIDVRDLSEWIIRMAEQKKTGVYNAGGPQNPLTMQQIVEACDANKEYIWIEDEFLLEKEVTVFTELPLWLPESDEQWTGFFQFNTQKAIDAGLTFRPLTETIEDTLVWSQQREGPLKVGIDPDKEQDIIAHYKRKINTI
jgi:2'-hydroxyisoflavone reductase